MAVLGAGLGVNTVSVSLPFENNSGLILQVDFLPSNVKTKLMFYNGSE